MKTALSILSLTLSLFFVCGCSKEADEAVPGQWVNNTEELTQQNKQKITITQGITGTLTLKEGNCMPIIGPNSTCKEYPVKRTVVVYPYTTLQEAEQTEHVYYKIDALPVLTVESDAEGFYQAKLSPGTYSVFILNDGKLFANSTDGQGGINPVRVDEDVVTTFNPRLDFAVY
ncbi:hypothetical protein [Pontibacter mangrovi]|uniref:Carboxypeptidase regulatory-like domain-containing protein n=1 Tax=Pontibacter mangrovi TaxID=2589816 RepID=A0A501VYY2_9BACT|nr:hypothetical protein [Pontibacter mangrovi]TPE42629.1 hypothetical protein FJM65_17605 [Pontibacter mangrovi]